MIRREAGGHADGGPSGPAQSGLDEYDQGRPRLGLTTQEHWYGLPESLFADRTIQDFRLDYNYNNEQHRFGEAGRLWKQAAPRGSDQWNSLMDELLELDFTFRPDPHHL